MHFLEPQSFLKIIPPYLNFVQYTLVYVSGFFEILFGFLLLFPKYRFYAGWGLLLLLIAVFPANYYLYESVLAREAYNGISQIDALVRMFFQLPLIMLAYWHSQKKYNDIFSYCCLIIFFPTIVYFIYITGII